MEFWIRVYQRTLGGQKKPSLPVDAPLPLSSFFPLSGGGCGYTQARKKPTKNLQKGGEKMWETWIRTKPKTPRAFLRCHEKIIIKA